MIELVLYGLGYVAYFIFMFTIDAVHGAIYMVVGGLLLALHIYFWLVVRSVYLDIKEGNEAGKIDFPMQQKESNKQFKNLEEGPVYP